MSRCILSLDWVAVIILKMLRAVNGDEVAVRSFLLNMKQQQFTSVCMCTSSNMFATRQSIAALINFVIQMTTIYLVKHKLNYLNIWSLMFPNPMHSKIALSVMQAIKYLTIVNAIWFKTIVMYIPRNSIILPTKTWQISNQCISKWLPKTRHSNDNVDHM